MFKNILLKCVVIVLFFGIIDSVFAAAPAPLAGELTEKQKMTVLFSREAVDSFLKDCEHKIKNGIVDGHKLSYRFYYLFAVQTKMWLNKSKQYPWEPELSTMIAWSWYVDLYKTFMHMSKYRKIRVKLEAKQLENSSTYKIAGKRFIIAYKHFLELKAKPTKLTKSRYLELKRAKAAWEKKEREKARAAARAKKRRSRS
jgi:hypothetical protein